jgi:hypothetical protein
LSVLRGSTLRLPGTWLRRLIARLGSSMLLLWMALASCRLPGTASAQSLGPLLKDGLLGSAPRPGPTRLGSLPWTPASLCPRAILTWMSSPRAAPSALRPLRKRLWPVRGTLPCCARALPRLVSCCLRPLCGAAAGTEANAGYAGTLAPWPLPVCAPAWLGPALLCALSSLAVRCVMRLLGSLLLP